MRTQIAVQTNRIALVMLCDARRTAQIPSLIGNARLFTEFLFTIFVPRNPPPPNQQNDGFPLEFLSKGPQTELRTLSQNCEQTLQNCEQTDTREGWKTYRTRGFQNPFFWGGVVSFVRFSSPLFFPPPHRVL